MADDMFRCPHDPPCGHSLHDIYELGDPYPTCCIEGCRCGHPGNVMLRWHENGVVEVLRADPVIRVAQVVLDEAEAWAYDGDVLQLDTAGVYRYRYLRPDPAQQHSVIFGRITDKPEARSDG